MSQIVLTYDNMEAVAMQVLQVLEGKNLRITTRCDHYGKKPIVKNARLHTDRECKNTSPVKKHDEGTEVRWCIRITADGATHHYPGEKVTITDKKVTFEGELSGKPETVEFEVI